MSAPLLTLALFVALAAGLSACGGSSKLLPGTTASQIDANLEEVRRLASEGDCDGASESAGAISEQVENLGVAKELKDALREGAARLNEVVAGCEEVSEEETSEALEGAEEPEPEEAGEKAEKPKKETEEASEPQNNGLPPQAKGEAKGHEEGNGQGQPAGGETPPPEVGGGTPAGGVSPSSPVEGGG